MPPPPPPSKSYLLVLDSDSSSDESEDESYFQQQYNRTFENINTVAPPQVLDTKNNINGRVNNDFSSLSLVDESKNDQNQQDSSSTKLTKNQKKNQKKRLQRKKKKKAAKQKEANTLKGVSFSDVSIREFPRAFSTDTVPAHGGWPLGMKLEGHEDLDQIPLDEYETSKQKRLHERWTTMLSARDKKVPGSPKSPSKKSSPSSKKKSDPVAPFDEKVIQMVGAGAACGESCSEENCNVVYETRQWDFKSRIKNPIFRSVSEDERHAIFLDASEFTCSEIQKHVNNSNSVRRARSNSIGNHNHNSNNNRRSRSNSVGNHDLGNSMKGKFNEEYNQAMVHHVRNELEQIRFERNKSGATGCNCRKLVVYLPPSDGSGGKKAQHRRLKPSKLVQELKKRNLYDSKVASSSREQMEKILHKAVEKEPCCKDADCFCVRNGINCQADACSCWHDSHVHPKHSSGSDGRGLTNDDIRTRCGNPLGTYLVETEAIEAYRTNILKAQNLQME